MTGYCAFDGSGNRLTNARDSLGHSMLNGLTRCRRQSCAAGAVERQRHAHISVAGACPRRGLRLPPRWHVRGPLHTMI